MTDKQTGARKLYAGRPPLHGQAMVKLNVRVPLDIKAAMQKQYGGVQKAVNVLVIKVVRQDVVNGANTVLSPGAMLDRIDAALDGAKK